VGCETNSETSSDAGLLGSLHDEFLVGDLPAADPDASPQLSAESEAIRRPVL